MNSEEPQPNRKRLSAEQKLKIVKEHSMGFVSPSNLPSAASAFFACTSFLRLIFPSDFSTFRLIGWLLLFSGYTERGNQLKTQIG